jgi:hypothetical protein
MKGNFTEFALNQAAQDEDCPLLARPFYLYRSLHNMSAESLAVWLGLDLNGLNELAMCLAPRPGSSLRSWEETFAELSGQFPTLRSARLQLLIASTLPTQNLIAS